jgi:hypothetical protein
MPPVTSLFSNMEVWRWIYPVISPLFSNIGPTYLRRKSFVFKYGGMANRGRGHTQSRVRIGDMADILNRRQPPQSRPDTPL